MEILSLDGSFVLDAMRRIGADEARAPVAATIGRFGPRDNSGVNAGPGSSGPLLELLREDITETSWK
jgi:hypothetical protein